MSKPENSHEEKAADNEPSVARDAVDTEIAHDPVFGEMTENGPNYRNVTWLGSSAIMMKTQVGLGVLSLPAVFDTLGMIPGIIMLLTIGGITTWSNLVIGTFKINHREVYSIDDAGELMFGRIGREVIGISYCLFLILVAGSGMLGTSIGLNAVSTHAACTSVFVAIAAGLGFSLASIRTLDRLSWIAWIGVTSIIISVFTVTVAVGVQDRPDAAPQTGSWQSDFKLVNNPSFYEAISAVTSLVFAYGGTPIFFSIASEMRNPHDYKKAVVLCQSVVTIAYIIVGCVVYYFCGSYVAIPALGSAGHLIKKVAYGIALPGLLAGTILTIHLPAKYVFLRLLRGTPHLTSNTPRHWITWLGSTLAVALVAYIVASAIPVFGGLVSLIGALFGTFMCFQPMGCMWLYDNWASGKERKTMRWTLMAAWSIFVIVAGTFLTIGGTYGSIVSIIAASKQSGGSEPWTCADNSNSV